MHSKKKSRARRRYHVIDPAMADFLYEDIENVPDFLGDLQLWFTNIYDRTTQAITSTPSEPISEFDNEFMQNARTRQLSTQRKTIYKSN